MNSRVSLPAKIWPRLARYSNGLVGGVIVAAGLVLLLALWLGRIDILPYTSQVGGEPTGNEATAIPNTVELAPEKLVAADLHTTTVQRQRVQPTREVPGEINY